ncbi:glycosyltransferase [Kingella negevensis]|uniref:Glycosyl transferase family 2 n=1 Tax=Kingella negevensis TaxID=1522312 RepID=A0A238TCD3_9NEIS|nr:glycosyltransferase [Kingella negevensis]MDK4683680.1 glycosyltransferase [Kingella negevensis]MDK4697713.1 glycosyltransferase [Kingella negevensis]MDK4708425.1 glycosyltransferase [Kingella negevensis]MDK4710914.1 glycosyltransferase [Kingella negevensis]SNB67517.1 Uncharacterised protein [Kingella negevensis]
MTNPTVAIITATIGRAELERAIQSVAAQTHPCTHYVFVDGKQHAAAARPILERYPHVKAVYLPVNTGGKRLVQQPHQRRRPLHRPRRHHLLFRR